MTFFWEMGASHPGLSSTSAAVNSWTPRAQGCGRHCREKALPKCWVLVSEFETCHEVAGSYQTTSCDTKHSAQVGSRPIYANTAVPSLYAAEIRKTAYTPKAARAPLRGSSDKAAVVAKPQAILHVCIEAFLRVQHVLGEAEYVVHLKKQYLTHHKFCEKSKLANMV